MANSEKKKTSNVHKESSINNSIHKNKKSYTNSKNTLAKEKHTYNIWLLMPLIICIALVPLIVKLRIYNSNFSQFKWSVASDTGIDFFLFYKQWILVAMAFIMLFVIFFKWTIDKKSLRFSPIFIPLVVYASLSFLSAVFSDYASFSFTGSLDQFESVLALLGYCIIVYYAFQCINSEKDMEVILKFFVISILIMSILGSLQFLGHDFFQSDFGKRLIVTRQFANRLDAIQFAFEKNRVYLTLFNPNYAGVYTALVAPVVFVLFLLSKKVLTKVLCFVAFLGMIIGLIGSQSVTGMIAVLLSASTMLIFFRRPVLRRFYISIPILILLVVGIFFVNNQTNNLMMTKIKGMFQLQKTENNIKDIVVGNDKVTFTYKGNKFHVAMKSEGVTYFDITDDQGNVIGLSYNEVTSEYTALDEPYTGLVLAFALFDDKPGFYVKLDGSQWNFALNSNGKYYYINSNGRLDKIKTAPSAVFTGYERIASSRGYLWSRTIPLIKKNIILGSGPDTFTMEFPQQDYVNLRYYFPGELVTKPHNMYLQIAVQTGLLSLIAFLTFYIMYAVTSIRLYMKGRFNSFYAKVGIAIFIGTISYMISGIANDSSITTAPVFWTLIGIGIVANHKAKPIIIEEVKEIQEEKRKKQEAN